MVGEAWIRKTHPCCVVSVRLTPQKCVIDKTDIFVENAMHISTVYGL